LKLKKQPISTIVQAFTNPESKVRISSGFTCGEYYRLSGQKKKIVAVSSKLVCTQFLQPITARIGDYSYLYIQYGISITFAPYNTGLNDSHLLLTREFSLLVPIKKLSLFPNL
jgi:hypothetical protein